MENILTLKQNKVPLSQLKTIIDERPFHHLLSLYRTPNCNNQSIQILPYMGSVSERSKRTKIELSNLSKFQPDHLAMPNATILFEKRGFYGLYSIAVIILYLQYESTTFTNHYALNCLLIIIESSEDLALWNLRLIIFFWKPSQKQGWK